MSICGFPHRYFCVIRWSGGAFWRDSGVWDWADAICFSRGFNGIDLLLGGFEITF